MAVGTKRENMFVSERLPVRSFRFFEDMRNKSEFCDVSFRLGNQETISAHRLIVTAVIPYFRDILTGPKIFQDLEEVISIPGIDSNAFKCLIEFAYSCKVKINTGNVWNLLRAACHFKVKEVRKACCDFVVDTLDVDNALNARQLASNLECSEMVKDIDCYVAENFVEISHTKDFLNCPSDYLQELLCRDDLHVDREKQVLESVLRWVKCSPEERGDVLPQLMCKIRMLHVDPVFLTGLTITEDLIRNSVLCRDLIYEAKFYYSFHEKKKKACSFVTEPRKTIEMDYHDCCDCISVRIPKLKFMAWYYDVVDVDLYSSKKNNYLDFDNWSSADVEDKSYLFRWGDTVQYNPSTNEYVFLKSKPTPSKYTEVAVFQNKIYLFGGEAGDTVCNAVECFDPQKDQWTRMKSMDTGRSGLSAATLGNYIYVLGGEDDCYIYKYIERYDPLRDKWRFMSGMLTARANAGAATLNGKIYICGGNAVHKDSVAYVEVYDPVKNSSNFVASLNVPRSRFSVVTCLGALYAVGGDDDKENVSIEIYDPSSNKWNFGPLLSLDMCGPNSDRSICRSLGDSAEVVSGPGCCALL